MFAPKKTLCSIFLLLLLSVTGSSIAATQSDFFPIFDPAAGDIPFPNNMLFSGSTDGTLNIPVADTTNLADPRVALNALDGFSTIAPFTARFSSSLKADSLQPGGTVRVFKVSLINPFLDPITKTPFAITGIEQELKPGDDYTVGVSSADNEQTTLTITPLRPLAPKSGYLVVLTAGIQDSGGFNAIPSPIYQLAKLEIPLINTSGKSVIPGLSDGQAQRLEPLRQVINNQENAAASQGIAKSSIVLSWAFMTQSIDDSFMALEKVFKPSALTLRATGSTTTAVGLGLPGFSDIYAGTLSLPYYLSKTKPLSSSWQTQDGDPITQYQPLPAVTETLPIPVLLTVPNASSGQRKPAEGWPVVIFQHGITRNRTDLFLLADALSFAGFAAIAIDLPLHGVTDKSNPFYQAGLERNFDLDLSNNTTGEMGSDGLIDASGSYFINLQNLLTSRDNLRQAAQDLRQLTAALSSVDLNDHQAPDLNPSRISFVGHSLGGIVGGTFLALEDKVTSATLAMAGGGIAKLLDGSPTFGPRIAAGLAAAGLNKGTLEYESYLAAAQAAADPGDPINYGTTAARLHPIHLMEVVGSTDSLPDQVVPNTVPHAPLAGTEALAKVMGLQTVSDSLWNDDGIRAIVRFTQGNHGSIIDPSASVGTTAEMQGQMIGFLQNAGTVLEIIYKPVMQ